MPYFLEIENTDAVAFPDGDIGGGRPVGPLIINPEYPDTFYPVVGYLPEFDLLAAYLARPLGPTDQEAIDASKADPGGGPYVVRLVCSIEPDPAVWAAAGWGVVPQGGVAGDPVPDFEELDLDSA